MAVIGRPENVVALTVPGGDYCISRRHFNQGKEPGTITNVVDVCARDVPNELVQKHQVVRQPELGQVGLLVCAGGAVNGTKVFNLVIGARVCRAVKIWRLMGAEL